MATPLYARVYIRDNGKFFTKKIMDIKEKLEDPDDLYIQPYNREDFQKRNTYFVKFSCEDGCEENHNHYSYKAGFIMFLAETEEEISIIESKTRNRVPKIINDLGDDMSCNKPVPTNKSKKRKLSQVKKTVMNARSQSILNALKQKVSLDQFSDSSVDSTDFQAKFCMSRISNTKKQKMLQDNQTSADETDDVNKPDNIDESNDSDASQISAEDDDESQSVDKLNLNISNNNKKKIKDSIMAKEARDISDKTNEIDKYKVSRNAKYCDKRTEEQPLHINQNRRKDNVVSDNGSKENNDLIVSNFNGTRSHQDDILNEMEPSDDENEVEKTQRNKIHILQPRNIRNASIPHRIQSLNTIHRINNKAYKTKGDANKLIIACCEYYINESSPGYEDRRKRYQETDNNMIYLGEGISVSKMGFEYMSKLSPSTILNWLAVEIWDAETLANRALQVNRCHTKLPGRSPTKQVEDKLLRLFISVFYDFTEKRVDLSQKERMSALSNITVDLSILIRNLRTEYRKKYNKENQRQIET